MLNQIVTDDLIIGRLEGQNRKIKLNFYYPDQELTTNSLIFDPQQMKQWWDYGYRVGQKNNPDCRIINHPMVTLSQQPALNAVPGQ